MNNVVIQAQELSEKIRKKESNLLKKAEESIDKVLLDEFDGTDMCIGTTVMGDLRRNLRNELIDKYRNAGWSVKYESDQRDGDFYRFTPQNTKKTNDQYHGLYGFGTNQYDR